VPKSTTPRAGDSPRPGTRRRRTALLAAFLLLLPGATAGQDAVISVNAAMAKGPVNAPVTIVEFSDYQ
jgi:hypothetical protein